MKITKRGREWSNLKKSLTKRERERERDNNGTDFVSCLFRKLAAKIFDKFAAKQQLQTSSKFLSSCRVASSCSKTLNTKLRRERTSISSIFSF